jgi:hypothetical protein
MKNFNKTAEKLVMLGLFPLAMAACNFEPTVSFSQDVKPILDQHCFECHLAGGKGELVSGLSMASYDELMEGTNFGPMIIAGDTQGSNLLVLVEGRADPSISMPHGQRDSVAKQDIHTIRLWIEQGAKNN